MIGLIYDLLGKYTFDAFSLVILFWQSQLCILLFMLRHHRRKLFALRFISGVVLGTLASVGIAVVNTEIGGAADIPVRILCYTAVSALNLAVVVFSYKESMTEILFCWCSGMAVYQFVGKLYPLLQNIVGKDDKTTISFINDTPGEWYDWIVYFVVQGGLYVLLAYIFRRNDFLHKDAVTSRGIALIAVMTTVVMNGLICVARLYESESFALNIVVKVFSMAFGLALLFICSELYARNRSRQEMNVLRQMWKQERSQFLSVKANIDYINAKCHDLKHLFDKLEGKLDEVDLERLKSAVKFYDNSVRTGNEILDVVLCEKITLCTSMGIRLTCMADGRGIDILFAAQTYSLFGNIIDNAIEAVNAIKDKDKRIISLTVTRRNGRTEISISNFYEGERNVSGDGLISTGKDDAARHGYGLKSVRHIVAQHGGETRIKAENGRFELRISLPEPNGSGATATPPRVRTRRTERAFPPVRAPA